ncbi:serpin family protein [Cohnella terricola]|uniref:Serpin family protein n=1 Tax=Cohnella terricola TaxID=1289167 RepID=A0A559JR41_9BACL|nr:serpin family protein [Cohnella terricola]TVY02333.1 serpin family protein [Cohnella terricola]
MRKKIGLIMLAAIVASSGCTRTNGDSERSKLQERTNSAYTMDDLDPRIVQSANRFGVELFGELYRTKPKKNIFLSPLSIAEALSLVSVGASGETAAEMEKALGLQGLKKEEIGRGYRVLVDLLSHPIDDGVETHIANSLWLRDDQPVYDEFLRIGRNDFNAETNRSDFKDTKTLKQMNKWVEEATNGKIKRMLERVEPDAALYLLNAVYFNGAWKEPFRAQNTAKAKFFVADGEYVETDMMTKGGYYEYTEKEGYEAIKLPYGKNESAYMAIVLPDQSIGTLDRLVSQIGSDPSLLTEAFEERPGRIELPKVKLDFSATLNDALNVLGIREAFDSVKGDFTGISPAPPNLYISKAEHKSAIEINEQGTEAAAATAIEMEVGGAQPQNPFLMSVNRPFVAAIVDRETGCILFAGVIFNPNEKKSSE